MKILAVCNQKGGVGKTTTALNLALAAQSKGQRVLLVDADPQGNLTSSLSGENRRCLSLSELIHYAVAGMDYDPTLFVAKTDSGPDLLPSSRVLAAASSLLGTVSDSGMVLREALDHLTHDGEDYDLVMIDCAPSLDLLVVNALNAADGVIIPTEPADYSVDGIVAMVETITRLQKTTNPSLEISQVVINKFDTRKKNHRAVKEDISGAFEGLVYPTPIPLVKEVEISAACPLAMARNRQSRVWPLYLGLAEVILRD